MTDAKERGEVLIELEDVTFGYGREVVLDGVSLSISERDFLAVIGPNGGGKTTLLRVVLGLVAPWSGRVRRRLGGRHGAGPPGAFGYVPQFAGFDRTFPLRVRDVVRMGRLGGRGLGRRFAAADDRAVDDMLGRFRLAALAETPIGELSGGQLQRALIARALVSGPRILFLDEPLASIDSVSREILTRTLEELHRQIPIVVVTHDLTPFARLVEQVACVNRRLHYHPSGEVTGEMLESVYGCPVELIAHGVPHRVLASHDHGGRR
ncbi:MAG TPA: metal ABC transporter ATP-binding protein [Thermoanaerobaculia bacterium]|jgi:zinc transport system ATP-binding protein